MNKDLTVGKPYAVLWKFCLPLLGSIIFQQLYNIADSFVAGKFIGENALAAVGNSYEITLIYIAFAFGCNIGCSVIVSNYFGSGNYKKMRTAVYTAGIFSAAICLALMIIGIFGSSFLLKLIRTPSALMTDSKLYLDIYTLSLPFVFFYNIATGVFSALGDSKTPFYFLAASSVSNIAVDIWFVKSFKMGVAGVALATLICQGISCIAAVIAVLIRLKATDNGEHAPIFDKKILRQIIVISVPSILQQSFISVGNIILQGIINGFGPSVVAGYSAAVKLNNLVVTTFSTLGNGISNYTAQNIGAGKLKRVHDGFKAGLALTVILSIPLFIAYFFFGDTLLGLFMNEPTPAAESTGITFLKIISPFYIVVAVKLTADGIMRGAGLMKKFMIDTFADLGLRVVFAILLSLTALKVTGVWYAWPIGWCIGGALAVIFYFTSRELKLTKSSTASEGS